MLSVQYISHVTNQDIIFGRQGSSRTLKTLLDAKITDMVRKAKLFLMLCLKRNSSLSSESVKINLILGVIFKENEKSADILSSSKGRDRGDNFLVYLK